MCLLPTKKMSISISKILSHDNKLKNKYQKMYRDGIINKTQRHQMFSEEVNRIFAERFGIEFGKEYFNAGNKI